MGLNRVVPLNSNGNKFLFDLMFTPNKLIGSTILEKSLFDKLLSPINLIFLLFPEHKPIIHLARVPEFPALIVIFLLLNPFIPTP